MKQSVVYHLKKKVLFVILITISAIFLYKLENTTLFLKDCKKKGTDSEDLTFTDVYKLGFGLLLQRVDVVTNKYVSFRKNYPIRRHL